MFQANAFGKLGISLIVLVPDCGNTAVAVFFLPQRRADGPFPCPGHLRAGARALLGSPPLSRAAGCSLRQGWESCKAAGAPPVGWQWPARRGQPAQGRAGVGTMVALRCPGSAGSPLSPSRRDRLGFPLGITARAKRESVAAWQALRPAAPSSAQQHPVAPSSCPRGGPR